MLASSLLLSALFAGLVATGVTLAIERWGGLVGGVLGTVPSTIVPAGIGIYLTGGEDNFVASMMVVPLGMLLNALFLGAWLVLPRLFSNASRPLLLTSIGALAFWCVMGMGAWFLLQNTVVGILFTEQEFAAMGLILLFLIAVWFNRRPQPAPKGTNAVSKTVLFARGSMAALAIGVAVWMAGLGLPLLAGLASVFPAIFLTSMVALWLAQGETVPRGAAGPMMLGSVSVAVYALVIMWSLPTLGPVLGTLVAWLVAVGGWSCPVYLVLRRRDVIHSLRESSALQPEPLQS